MSNNTITSTSMDLTSIIEAITCPITADIMTDPVQGIDGQTYERSAIIQALNNKLESPITRCHMTINDLKVNASIRFLCDKYHSGAFGNNNTTTNRKLPTVSYDNIKMLHHFYNNTNNKHHLISFEIDSSSLPDNTSHLSQDVVIIIDHSGSMGLAVEAKDETGNKLENGMSIQDIVNHAAKTVAKTLDKNSRLSVIIFDNRIDILFELMPMTEINCSTALSKIGDVKPCGQTNIWGALEQGIKLLNDREDKTRNGAIVLLTDGSPNISPARGEIDALKRLRQSLNFTSPIYTFGFGYSLSRGLLYELAKYGNGGNGHIPDGGMIATVFCNFIGTIMATVAVNLQLHIDFDNNDDNEVSSVPNFAITSPVMGDYVFNQAKDKPFQVIVDLGTVQIGQSRDIIINVPFNPLSGKYYNFTYFYTYKIGGKSFKIDGIDSTATCSSSTDANLINRHIARYTIVELLRKIINHKNVGDDSAATDIFLQMDKYYSNHPQLTDTLSVGIKNNITDQVKLAITNEKYYNRWGEFYIDQLSRSMNQQIKPNFKDTACMFGGKIFEELVDKASDIFDELPPPVPSLISLSGATHSGSNIHSQVASLASYNSHSAPCFDSECLITLADNTKIPLKTLNKGDKIAAFDWATEKSTTATIICVLETRIRAGSLLMSKFNSYDEQSPNSNILKITPYHPVYCFGEWHFPSDLTKLFTTEIVECYSIISLVLDNSHVAYINDIPCITLAHGYMNGILRHPYFGTHDVLQDLQNMDGWDNGHITIWDNSTIRNTNTGLVKKMLYNPVIE